MQEPGMDDRLESAFAAALKSGPESSAPECLTPERMVALAEQTLPAAEAAAALSHVALCLRCRREYAETAELLQLSQDVAAAKAQPVPAPVPAPSVAARRAWPFPAWRSVFAPPLGFGLGAAAGMGLLFALTAPTRTQRDRLAADLRARDAQAAQTARETGALTRELASLRRERGDASRLAAQTARLRAENQRQNLQIAQLSAAEAALEQTPLPEAAWKTPQGVGQTRGTDGAENAAPEITLLRPVNTAVAETRPALEFRPTAGATDYRVRLEMADSNAECPAPVALSPTRWQTAAALRPGQVYQWAVTAQRGGKLLHSTLAKFYILSAADSRELAAARRTYARNPLALGAVCARLGLRSEAAAQFRAALKANPQNAVAKRWLKETQP